MVRISKMIPLQIGVLLLIAPPSVGLATPETEVVEYLRNCFVEHDGINTRLHIGFSGGEALIQVNVRYLGEDGRGILSVPLFSNRPANQSENGQTIRVRSEFSDRVVFEFLFNNIDGVLDVEELSMQSMVPQPLTSDDYRLPCFKGTSVEPIETPTR